MTSRLATFARASGPWFCAALSGALMILCFAPADQDWLCWLALTPLVAVTWFTGAGAKRRHLRNAGLGYVAGVVFFTGTFSWLASLADLFATPFLFFLPLLLALYLGLFFAAWTWILGLLRRRAEDPHQPQFMRSRENIPIAFLAAAAWVAMEWIRGWMFTGFGWNGAGVALAQNLAFIQIAGFTGVAGLSFLVIFANVIAVLTVRRLVHEAGRRRLRPRWDFSFTIVLVVGTFTHGMWTLQERLPTREISVAAVQANIPQNEKFDHAFEDKIIERYTRLTRTAMAIQPDLILWPEAATPQALFANERNFRFVLDLADESGTNLLLGSLDSEANDDYNVAAMVARRSEEIQIYRKMHLVPFGEFLPFRRSFPLFAWVAGDLVPGDFAAGTEHRLLETREPDVRIGPLICFEDTVGELTRRFVRNGAELLVNLTNDGWFGQSVAAEQHLRNAIFRAVENRRPLLRAANTGVTCFIDHRGRVTQALRDEHGSHFLEGILIGKVAVPEDLRQTFYTRYGELFAIAATALTALFLIVRGWRSRRSQP